MTSAPPVATVPESVDPRPGPAGSSGPVDGAPLRVALLGCGVVGSEVARLLTEQAADLQARVGRPLDLVGIARAAARTGTRPGIDRSLFTTDAAGTGVACRHRPGDRGDRRHRAGALVHPHRAAARGLGGDRQQGAAGRGRSDPVLRGRERRGGPLLRGGRGRGDPDHPPPARVVGRRRDHLGDRHRQRDDQLHPGQDGRRLGPDSPRRSPRRRTWDTPRRTPPPTSRASTPPPRPPSWPAWPSTPGSPAPTSTARESPR